MTIVSALKLLVYMYISHLKACIYMYMIVRKTIVFVYLYNMHVYTVEDNKKKVSVHPLFY